jgi:chloramphenicol 3-O phosphotransferase
MPQLNLILITGSSGVGKSSLAKALQELLLPDQWLSFSVDSIFYCLPPSIVLKVDQANDHSAVDSRAIVASAHACTRTLLDQGHRVIFDAVILSAKGANDLLGAFAPYRPLIVNLTCAWEEISRRTVARGDRTLAEADHGYRNAGGHLEADLTLDSTAVSPEWLALQVATAARAERR